MPANKLIARIEPSPALLEIPLWCKYSNVHLLSNHRKEWVKHIIGPVECYPESITIFSDVGFCKPEIDIYLKVNSHLNSPNNVLYIDDLQTGAFLK